MSSSSTSVTPASKLSRSSSSVPTDLTVSSSESFDNISLNILDILIHEATVTVDADVPLQVAGHGYDGHGLLVVDCPELTADIPQVRDTVRVLQHLHLLPALRPVLGEDVLG